MKYHTYMFKASNAFRQYEFVSEGPKGSILKRVEFEPVENNPNVYNLAFGDVNVDDIVDDMAVTNNQDGKKVLATVGLTVVEFFKRYPNAILHVGASTPSRMRLYRMLITLNLEEIERGFCLNGLMDNRIYAFQRERVYSRFIVKKKTL